VGDLARVAPQLLSVERAQQMLAACVNVDEAKQIRDQAQAIKAYLRTQKASLGAQNDAAEIKLRAERRLGELTREIPKATAEPKHDGRGGKSPATGPLPKAKQIEDLGMTKQRVAEYEKVASLPQDQFDAYVQVSRASGGELTTAGALRLAAGGRLAAFSSESVEWYTPTQYIEAARKVLGSFDLDPASSDKANATVRAKRIFTVDDDGLAQDWRGRVWLNPPYGGEDGTGVWVEKLCAEFDAKRTTDAILLVNAVTDRVWFQSLWRFAICFTDHRIKFYTPSGQPQSPISGNAFVYLGPTVGAFAKVFNQFGHTVVSA
jgi:phage N-6-adenine-methyltransferase